MSWFRRSRVMRKHVHQRLFVTLRDGGSFSGLLLDVDSEVLEFADVKLVSGTNTAPVDGYLIVERARISYMQKTAVTDATV